MRYSTGHRDRYIGSQTIFDCKVINSCTENKEKT